MGQYYKGNKIGTCETMYYMRLDEAVKLALLNARDDDNQSFASLLTDNVTMFRFPFPDEDILAKQNNLASRKEFNPSFKLFLPPNFEVIHGNITTSHGQPNVNYFIPCPYDKECTIKHSPLPQQTISIMYQAMRYPLAESVDGTIYENRNTNMVKATLYECSTCGQLQRTSQEEMAEVVEYNKTYFTEIHTPRDMPMWKDPDFIAKNKKELDYKLEILRRIWNTSNTT